MIRFFAISDIHIIANRSSKTAKHRKKAFEWLKNNNFDFGLFVGDVTNNSRKEEFEIAESELSALMEATPVFMNFGNHDYIDEGNTNTDNKYREAFTEKANSYLTEKDIFEEEQINKPYRSYRIKGIQIICLDCAYSYPSTRAGDEQLKWLDERLSESDSDRLRIVMNHFPLNAVVPGHSGKKQTTYIRDSHKIQAVLEKHGNILYFSGHTHYTPDSDSKSVIYDNKHKIAYINTGSVGNTIPNAVELKTLRHKIRDEDNQSVKELLNEEFKKKNSSGSTGILVDISDNKVNINGFDFVNKAKIDRCFFEITI